MEVQQAVEIVLESFGKASSFLFCVSFTAPSVSNLSAARSQIALADCSRE